MLFEVIKRAYQRHKKKDSVKMNQSMFILSRKESKQGGYIYR